MNYQVQFCFPDRNDVVDRYLARVPQAGENVSFPLPKGHVPSWETYKVLRVHTFLALNEHRYSVEIEKCS